MRQVKAKLEMLEALADLKLATNVLKHEIRDEHPVDTHYRELKCDLEAVDVRTAGDVHALVGRDADERRHCRWTPRRRRWSSPT